MIDRPFTLSALLLALVCVGPETTFGQSTTAVEAGANRAPDFVAPPAGYARYRNLRPSVVDYYLTERRRDWGYELDFDYDRLSYDEGSSVYSLYDTYYNNYEVVPAAPGVVDPRRDATVITPGEAIDVVPDADAMPRRPAVSPRSPIVPGERPVVVDDDLAVPDDNLIEDDDLFDEPNDEVLYGYDERDDADNWVYDYYQLPNYGDAVRPPSYYEQFDVVSDLEGDGPFDGFQAPENRNRTEQAAANRQPQRQPQGENQVPMTTLAGTVTMVKNVPIRGTEVSHRVVQIEAKDGKRYTVDLGNTQTFSNLPLQAGTDITVDGNLTTIGDQELLIAKELNASGERILIERSQRVVRGNVVNTRMLDYDGGQIVLTTVDTQSGTAVVDMGLAGILDKVVLKPGSPVTVSGREVQIDSQNILLAETVVQGATEAKTLRPNIEANPDVQTAPGQTIGQNENGNAQSKQEMPRRKLTIASTIDENGQKRTLALPPESEGEANARRQQAGQEPEMNRQNEAAPAPQGNNRDVAAQNRNQNRNANQPQNTNQNQQANETPMVRLEGTVDQVDQKEVAGRSRQVVVVTTKGGNTVRLDMGPAKNSELKLQKGDAIRAEGALTQLDSKQPLILAERVTKGDKSYTAPRYRSDMKTVQVTGKVTEVATDQVLGKQHHILTLQTNDQQKLTVDAGPSDDQSLDFETGATLNVEGVMLDLQQGNLIVADSVSRQ